MSSSEADDPLHDLRCRMLRRLMARDAVIWAARHSTRPQEEAQRVIAEWRAERDLSSAAA